MDNNKMDVNNEEKSLAHPAEHDYEKHKKNPGPSPSAVNEDDDLMMNEKITDKKVNNSVKMAGDNMLAQVVGLILGSPEFQRK